MRALVVVLMIANICLFWGARYLEQPFSASLEDGRGRLRRVGDLRVPAGRQPASQGEKASTGESERRHCGRITGFRSYRSARRFADDNEPLFDMASVDSSQSGSDDRFWVIVPPFENHAKALSMLARFQRAGIDSHLVTEGKYRSAVFLGEFDSKREAEDLKSRFRSQNMETALVIEPPDQIRYALAFEANARADRAAVASRVERYSRWLKLTGFQSCQGVATSSESP